MYYLMSLYYCDLEFRSIQWQHLSSYQCFPFLWYYDALHLRKYIYTFSLARWLQLPGFFFLMNLRESCFLFHCQTVRCPFFLLSLWPSLPLLLIRHCRSPKNLESRWTYEHCAANKSQCTLSEGLGRLPGMKRAVA